MSRFFERVWRAASLDPQLYEEVEADQGALGQAATVVVLSSLAAGIGLIPVLGPTSIVVATIQALLGWGVWALLTYFIGTRLLPEPQTRADPGQLLRTIGFASSPGLIRVFGLIPLLTPLVMLIAHVWMLVAMVVAVRQALDYRSTGRAVAVCLIGFLAQILLTAFFLRPATVH